MFDHKVLRDHQVVCAGLGGIVQVLDTRRLGTPIHSVADPYLQDIVEISVTPDGDMMALGQNGFTLWKTSRSGFIFRGFQETNGVTRGGFVDSKRGFTTDSDGTFQEWEFKRHVGVREKAVAVPPYSREGGRVPGGASAAAAMQKKTQPLRYGSGIDKRGCDDGYNDSASSSSSSTTTTTTTTIRANTSGGGGDYQTPMSDDPTPSMAGTPTVGADGEWDWDLDFQYFEQKGSSIDRGAEEATALLPSTEKSKSSQPSTPSSTTASLSLKDLDELIGFYLS